MKRLILLMGLVCAALPAQTSLPAYLAYREQSLSGTGTAVTIQQPASPTRTVVFDKASVYCSVACDVTFERDGTAATTTAFTPNAVASNTDAPTALAFHSSNAGTGTVLSKWSVPAGVSQSFDLNGMRLPRIAGRNVTLRISTITGTARVSVKYTEGP